MMQQEVRRYCLALGWWPVLLDLDGADVLRTFTNCAVLRQALAAACRPPDHETCRVALCDRPSCQGVGGLCRPHTHNPFKRLRRPRTSLSARLEALVRNSALMQHCKLATASACLCALARHRLPAPCGIYPCFTDSDAMLRESCRKIVPPLLGLPPDSLQGVSGLEGLQSRDVEELLRSFGTVDPVTAIRRLRHNTWQQEILSDQELVDVAIAAEHLGGTVSMAPAVALRLLVRQVE